MNRPDKKDYYSTPVIELSKGLARYSKDQDEYIDFLDVKVALMQAIEKAENEVTMKPDVEFIYNLLPEWIKEFPEGLDPTFYGTGTKEGDEKTFQRVQSILKKL